MRWTDEQARAIGARGGSLLLSAAAGSGKTTVLVERVLRLILDDGRRHRPHAGGHLHARGGVGHARQAVRTPQRDGGFRKRPLPRTAHSPRPRQHHHAARLLRRLSAHPLRGSGRRSRLPHPRRSREPAADGRGARRDAGGGVRRAVGGAAGAGLRSRAQGRPRAGGGAVPGDGRARRSAGVARAGARPRAAGGGGVDGGTRRRGAARPRRGAGDAGRGGAGLRLPAELHRRRRRGHRQAGEIRAISDYGELAGAMAGFRAARAASRKRSPEDEEAVEAVKKLRTRAADLCRKSRIVGYPAASRSPTPPRSARSFASWAGSRPPPPARFEEKKRERAGLTYATSSAARSTPCATAASPAPRRRRSTTCSSTSIRTPPTSRRRSSRASRGRTTASWSAMSSSPSTASAWRNRGCSLKSTTASAPAAAARCCR